MAVHEIELHCEACARKTLHRFEYPSEDYANTAMCEVCETFREIAVEVRHQRTDDEERERLAAAAQLVKLTTAPSLAGYEIVETVEIVTAESVMGMSALTDLAGSVRDLLGGRSKAIEDTLRQARRNCLADLRREAVMVGANAVIGVRLDYSELSGGGKSMLFLVASGTAVKVDSMLEVPAADHGA